MWFFASFSDWSLILLWMISWLTRLAIFEIFSNPLLPLRICAMDLPTWDWIIEVEAVGFFSLLAFICVHLTDLRSASASPPPRPPLPTEEELLASSAPPRPPLPEFDLGDEENYDRDLPVPQYNQPILVRNHRSTRLNKTDAEREKNNLDHLFQMAAHDLHLNIQHYSSHDNDLIALAKKMAHYVAQLSLLMR